MAGIKPLCFTISIILTLFLHIQESGAVKADFKSINSSRAFNPFNMSSWFLYPSQVLQYWFPLFRPNYYPSNLKKPTTSKPPSKQNEKPTEKPKPENIFGISGPADDVDCISPGEFEW